MQWLEPWTAVADEDWPPGELEDYYRGWEEQLAQEVGPNHLLFQQTARLIARMYASDDALFQLPDGRVAEVHLTWSKPVELDPFFPATTIFASLDEWARDSLSVWHRDGLGPQ